MQPDFIFCENFVRYSFIHFNISAYFAIYFNIKMHVKKRSYPSTQSLILGKGN